MVCGRSEDTRQELHAPVKPEGNVLPVPGVAVLPSPSSQPVPAKHTHAIWLLIPCQKQAGKGCWCTRAVGSSSTRGCLRP